MQVVCDDYYPLWWLLSRWMGWRSPLLESHSAHYAPKTPSESLGVLLWDNREALSTDKPNSISSRLFRAWFPNVTRQHIDDLLASLHSGGKSLVCFRSLTSGIAGRSMMVCIESVET